MFAWVGTLGGDASRFAYASYGLWLSRLVWHFADHFVPGGEEGVGVGFGEDEGGADFDGVAEDAGVGGEEAFVFEAVDDVDCQVWIGCSIAVGFDEFDAEEEAGAADVADGGPGGFAGEEAGFEVGADGGDGGEEVVVFDVIDDGEADGGLEGG